MRRRSATLIPAQQTSGNKKAEEDANKDAESKVKEIDEAGKKTGNEVVDKLIHAVIDVEVEVPERFSK